MCALGVNEEGDEQGVDSDELDVAALHVCAKRTHDHCKWEKQTVKNENAVLLYNEKQWRGTVEEGELNNCILLLLNITEEVKNSFQITFS
ncbi:unnamed protein product [Caretta caretta]